MRHLPEFAKEIAGYAREYIKLTIENFEPYAQFGSKWDEEDYGSFRILVSNEGEMDVKNLKLHINGLFGKVRFVAFTGMTASEWKRHIEVPVGFVEANSSRYIYAMFQFHATDDTQGVEKPVLEAHVSDYDVSFDSMLKDKTTHEFFVRDTVSTQIHQL